MECPVRMQRQTKKRLQSEAGNNYEKRSLDIATQNGSIDDFTSEDIVWIYKAIISFLTGRIYWRLKVLLRITRKHIEADAVTSCDSSDHSRWHNFHASEIEAYEISPWRYRVLHLPNSFYVLISLCRAIICACVYLICNEVRWLVMLSVDVFSPLLFAGWYINGRN